MKAILDDKGIPWANIKGKKPSDKIIRIINEVQMIKDSGTTTAIGWVSVTDECITKGNLPHGFKTKFKRKLDSVFGGNLDKRIKPEDFELEKLKSVLLKKPLTEIMKGREKFLRYEKQIKNYGEEMTRNPLVTLSTIHSAKGMECDNVWLDPSITNRTRQSEEEDQDGERRVWYVGVTRAKEKLVIGEPLGKTTTQLL